VGVPLCNVLFLVISENITISHILPKLDSSGYISVTESMVELKPLWYYWLQSSESGKLMQNHSHYAIQGHSGSLISVPVESPHANSTRLGWTLSSEFAKFGLKKLKTYHSMVWGKAYFSILNHRCWSQVWQTGGQTYWDIL